MSLQLSDSRPSPSFPCRPKFPWKDHHHPSNTIGASTEDKHFKHAFLLISTTDSHCRKYGRDLKLYRRKTPNSSLRRGLCIQAKGTSLLQPLFISLPQSLPFTLRDPTHHCPPCLTAAPSVSDSSQMGKEWVETGANEADASPSATEPGPHRVDPVPKAQKQGGLAMACGLASSWWGILWRAWEQP